MPKAKPVIETVVVLKLSQIATTFSNARYDVQAARESEGGIKELAQLILVNGQETPVLVRPNPENKGGAYQLVCGARRYAAISLLSKEGKHTAQIKAVVRDMSDAEAAIANASENTARNDLNAPDTAFALHQIRTALEAETGNAVTDKQLALMTGISVAWANRLGRIIKLISDETFTLWRKHNVPVPFMNDTICKLKRDDQPQAVLRFLNEKAAAKNGKGGKTGSGEPPKRTKKGPNAWIDSAAIQASEAGRLVALLCNSGSLTFNGVWEGTELAAIVSTKYAAKVAKPGDTTQKSIDDADNACVDAFNEAFNEHYKAPKPAVAKAGTRKRRSA